MAARQPVLPPLHQAVKDYDYRRVRQRLAAGDSVDELAEGYSIEGTLCAPLHIAVGNRDKKMIKLLLDSSADVLTVTKPDGRSLVHLAAMSTDVEVCKMVVAAGAQVDRVEVEAGSCPIHYAATMHNAEMVQFLLSRGATVDVTELSGMTPLFMAAKQGRMPVPTPRKRIRMVILLCILPPVTTLKRVEKRAGHDSRVIQVPNIRKSLGCCWMQGLILMSLTVAY